MGYAKKLLRLLLIAVFLQETLATSALMSWFYQGSILSSNTTISLNVGDTFVAQCKGAGSSTLGKVAYIDFFVSKSAPVGSDYTLSSLTSGQFFTVTLKSGTLVYSRFAGHETGYDHWYIDPHYTEIVGVPSYTFMTAHIAVSRLSTGDAGTYYCSWYDGTDTAAPDCYANSVGLTLVVTTKTSGARSSLNANKVASYSVALLSSMKILF